MKRVFALSIAALLATTTIRSQRYAQHSHQVRACATTWWLRTVASRTIIWSLMKQIRPLLVPLLHGLHRRLAAQC